VTGLSLAWSVCAGNAAGGSSNALVLFGVCGGDGMKEILV